MYLLNVAVRNKVTVKSSKPIRYLLVIIIGIVAAFFIALFSIDLNQYSERVTQSLVGAARSNGVILNMKDTRLGLGSFHVSQTTVFVPAGPVPLALQLRDTSIGLSWLSLITFNPSIKMHSEMYGGSLLGWLDLSPSKSMAASMAGEFTLEDLDLAQQPQMQSLGVNGKFSIRGRNLLFNSSGIQDGIVEIQLKSGSKPNPSNWDLRNFGVPLKLDIPKIDNLNLESTLELEDGFVTFNKFSLTSSLTEITMAGKMYKKPESSAFVCDLTVMFSFSKEGLAIVGKFLPLLNRNYNESTDRISVKISGSSRTPKLEWN